ncbi:8691_t:CDS:2, partial [Paraglomus occultum]
MYPDVSTMQNLPEDLVEKQQQFLSFILFRRREHNYPLKYIANLDKTSVAFDLPSMTTVDKHGTKTQLPATCIFKLRTIPHEEFPMGINVRVNEKGWCNETEMLWWINNVWSKRLTNQYESSRSLLVLNSFHGHLVNSVKQQFVSKKTDLAVIPGGLTSKLQPLDVMINHSFKAKMRIQYNEWMTSEI